MLFENYIVDASIFHEEPLGVFHGVAISKNWNLDLAALFETLSGVEGVWLVSVVLSSVFVVDLLWSSF